MWNDIARTVIDQRQLDPWKAAHVLVLLNFALADSSIAAALHGDSPHGGRSCLASPSVAVLTRPTAGLLHPTHSDYPSLAAASSAAAAEVLTADIGELVGFEATSPTLPRVSRRFGSFAQAARDAGLSRVCGGIHFFHAVRDGFAQGSGSIGREVRRMPPRSGGDTKGR